MVFSMPYSLVRQVIKDHFNIQLVQDEFIHHASSIRKARREENESDREEKRRKKRKAMGLAPADFSKYDV